MQGTPWIPLCPGVGANQDIAPTTTNISELETELRTPHVLLCLMTDDEFDGVIEKEPEDRTRIISVMYC